MAWDDAAPTAEEIASSPSSGGWDSAPPTAAELGQSQERGTSFSDIPANAMQEINQFKKFATATPEEIEAEGKLNSPGQAWQEAKDFGKGMASGIWNDVKGYASHPIDYSIQHPLGTVANVAGLAAPLVGAEEEAANVGLNDLKDNSLAGGADTLASKTPGEAPIAEPNQIADKSQSAAHQNPTMIQKAAARGTSAFLGPEYDAMMARIENPDAVKNFVPEDMLAQRLPETLKTLRGQIAEADKSAWKTLRTSYEPEDGAISKDAVSDIIKKAKAELKVYGGGTVGPAAKKAVSALDAIDEDVSSVGKHVGGVLDPKQVEWQKIGSKTIGRGEYTPKNVNLPEATIKGIIQSLDDNINWGDETMKPSNTALENARTMLDNVLKKQNPAYEKAMAPVAEKLRLLKTVQKQFNVNSIPGGEFQTGTKTESVLGNALGKNRSAYQQTLEALKNHTGEDYLGDVQTAKYGHQFEPRAIQGAAGSRRTMLGTGLGLAGEKLGVLPPGASTALGGLAGFFTDLYGGPAAGKIANLLASPKFAKFTRALEQGARTGAKGFMLTHNILSEHNPEYADAIKKVVNE